VASRWDAVTFVPMCINKEPLPTHFQTSNTSSAFV
jgi:hypothetical protein